MTSKTTRNNKYSENRRTLFLAFELGATEWKLGFSIGLGQKPRRRTVPGRDLEKLQLEIAAAKKRFQLSPDAPVVSCYEAGRDGFWLHRYLTQAEIRNSVVDSSSIEVNRRKRRAKTDGLDVAKLLVMLMRHHYGEPKVWSVVCAPSAEEEDRRQTHRELRALKKEKTRTTNRIKGLLASQGIRLTGGMNLSGKQLDVIRLWDGSPLPPMLKSRLRREWEHVEFLKQQIVSVEAERRRLLQDADDPDVAKIKQLTLLKGVGLESSWISVRELFGWRKFRNGREVGSLVGLIPTPFQSGDTNREQGISKAGNRQVRGVSIELAWSWVRHQPESKLTLWFLERFGSAGKRARKVGIVALARRLMVELWKFLEYGVLPEGARLRTDP
jgi:transposase